MANTVTLGDLHVSLFTFETMEAPEALQSHILSKRAPCTGAIHRHDPTVRPGFAAARVLLKYGRWGSDPAGNHACHFTVQGPRTPNPEPHLDACGHQPGVLEVHEGVQPSVAGSLGNCLCAWRAAEQRAAIKSTFDARNVDLNVCELHLSSRQGCSKRG